jgi:UDP-glucose 4-epimerase
VGRALITGGAGFIGSSLADALLQRGEEVRILDNFSTGRQANLQGLDGRVDLREGDLRDRRTVQDAVRGVDIIFHHAALVSVPLSMDDPETCDAVNVHGTVNLLSAARWEGVRRVGLASSAAVYGDSPALPLSEEAALAPLSPYAVSKQVNELYAHLFHKIYGLDTVCLRYFNVYGPRQSPESQYAAAIPIFLRKMLAGDRPTIYGDGSQVRDFIFIGDVVRANLAAGEAAGAPGRTFNICSGVEIKILDLVGGMNQVLGSDLEPVFEPPRAGDIYRSLGDPSRAANEIDFSAETSLEEGLALTAEWLRLG